MIENNKLLKNVMKEGKVMNEMLIYLELEKYNYIDSRTLARKLGIEHRQLRLKINKLRKMFVKNKVDKFVCINKNGYYLSDNLDDAIYSLSERRKKAFKMLQDTYKEEQAFITRKNIKLILD